MKFSKRIILLALGIPQILLAQDQTPDSTLSLDKVVISVNRFEEKSREVAQQFLIIDHDAISKSNTQNTGDLLANTGQVFVQKSQQGGGSPVLRGFEASRVLLVVDGIRMNNLIYRAGHLQNVITLDQGIMDHVDILFGPSSTVYGSDALGGAIVFHTRMPQLSLSEGLENKVNGMVRFGSANNEFTGHADFNIGGGKVASLTSVTYSKFGDQKMGHNFNPFYPMAFGERPYYQDYVDGKDSLVQNEDRFVQVETGYSQYDVLEKILYRPSDKTSHLVNLQYSNSTDIPRYDRLTDPAGAGLSQSEWYYGPQSRLLAAYDFKHYIGDGFFRKTNFILSYQDIQESRHSRGFGSSRITHRVEDVSVIGYTLSAEGHEKGHDLRVGIDGQLSAVTSTAERENITTGEITTQSTRYPDGDNSLMQNSAYFTHNWEFAKGLVLNDGLRLGISSLQSEQIDTSFYQLQIPKLEQSNFIYSGYFGLAMSPGEDWKFSLLWSAGYRVPNIDDLAKIFETAPGQVIVPNPDLKPERTSTYELGITRVKEGKLSWENTFYYTDFFDAIVTDSFKFNGQDSVEYDGTTSEVLANQNKGRAYIWGFNTVVRASLDDHFSTTASLIYTYGRLRKDSTEIPLDHISPLVVRLAVKYDGAKAGGEFFIPFNGWKRMKDYNPFGEDNEQYATPDGMPAWFTLNLRGYVKVNEYITIQAGVDNILDTQYRTFSSGINAPGRNVFGAIRVNV